MAKQHFYSRVPAKVSMFNRADGLDTFACSDGLTEEGINASLSCVFSNKPTKDEAPLIRDGKIPPVYFHFSDKDGNFIQSCMSFLPVDYTGERTGYLVHSLIMNNDEANAVLHSPVNSVLNRSLFIHNLDGFDLTSFASTYNDEYPELTYAPESSKGALWLKEAYDADMLKRLIYAFICIACGSGKAVYISLCDDLSSCSEQMLDFLNSFIQIFPYHLRARMPFVTYTPDDIKYSAFKIKGILERDNNSIHTTKAIVLNMRQSIFLGLKDEAVMEERFLVEFFYELIGNDALRREFLTYTENVYLKMPELAKMNTKALRELVLLFCQCSGLYEENKILPNENAVQDFLAVYEKYRNALGDEFRANAMVCLRRFPDNYIQIPSKTFTKVVKLYPGEPQYSRKIIMAVMLKLIHTENNKTKLFQFLRNSYPGESEEIRRQITEDLCRVYYGGFMRPQILEFFDEVFEQEPTESRNEILEKILLTVRTEAIQSGIIAFAEKYYGLFTTEQKHKLFVALCEALSDGGDSMLAYAEVIDRYINDSECGEEFTSIFLKQIEREQKRQKKPMFSIVCAGKYKNLYLPLCKKVFTEWSGRAILKGFTEEIFKGSLEECISNVATVFSVTGDVNAETQTVMFDGLAARINEIKKRATVVSLIEAEAEIRRLFGDNDFGEDIITEAVFPAIEEKLPHILNEENGLERLTEYSKLHPEINKAPGYEIIRQYCLIESALKNNDSREFFNICAAIHDEASLAQISKLLNAKYKKADSLAAATARAMLALIPLYIPEQHPDINEQFNSVRDAIRDYADISAEKDKNFAIEVKAFETLIPIWNGAVESVESERRQAIIASFRPVGKLVAGFTERYKRVASKWLADARRNEFAGINKDLAAIIFPEKKSFFGIFGK